MIVIRNVFRLKFGKAREAVALFKEGIAIQPWQIDIGHQDINALGLEQKRCIIKRVG